MRELLEEYGGAMLNALMGAVFIDLLRRFLELICGF